MHTKSFKVSHLIQHLQSAGVTLQSVIRFCLFRPIHDRKCFTFAGPDPPIKLEKMEETTNKISLALEIQEDSLRTKPGRCFAVCSDRWHIS